MHSKRSYKEKKIIIYNYVRIFIQNLNSIQIKVFEFLKLNLKIKFHCKIKIWKFLIDVSKFIILKSNIKIYIVRNTV